MADQTGDYLVIEDDAGNYYLLSTLTLAEARLPEEEKEKLEALLSEDTRGYYAPGAFQLPAAQSARFHSLQYRGTLAGIIVVGGRPVLG